MDFNSCDAEMLRIIIVPPKGTVMSEVQFQGTFVVAPAQGTTLTVTPASEQIDLTVGVPADGTEICQVSGGTPPYNYALDSNSSALPTGTTFQEDGNGNVTLAGTPSVAGTSSSPVILDITDSAPASAAVRASFKVGAKKVIR